MAKLSETHPALRDKERRDEIGAEQVSRSSAIEGIYFSAAEVRGFLTDPTPTTAQKAEKAPKRGQKRNAD